MASLWKRRVTGVLLAFLCLGAPLAQADSIADLRNTKLGEALGNKSLTEAQYKELLQTIRKEVPEDDKAIAYVQNWIYALDTLFVLGKRFGFKTPSKELKELADFLTQVSVKTLNFADADYELIVMYLKWARDTRAEVLRIQASFVHDDSIFRLDRKRLSPVDWSSRFERRKKRMLVWHEKLAKVCNYIDTVRQTPSELGAEYDLDTATFLDCEQAVGSVHSKVIGQLLDHVRGIGSITDSAVEVSDDKIDEIISQCLSEYSIMTVLDRFETLAREVKGKRAARLVQWALKLASQLEMLRSDTYHALLKQAGAILITALSSALDAGETFDVEFGARIVSLLKSTRQSRDLANELVGVFSERLVSSAQIDFLYALNQGLHPRVTGSAPFEAIVQRTVVQQAVRTGDWEGSYDITIDQVHVHSGLTLSFTGRHTLAVGIYRAPNGPGHWIPNLQYQPENKDFKFYAYRDDRSDSFYFNLVPGFDNKTGKRVNYIRGWLWIKNMHRWLWVEGPQTNHLERVKLEDRALPWEPIDGVFCGIGLGGAPIKITIKEVGRIVDAEMLIAHPRAIMSFGLPDVFIDRSKRLLFLTGSEPRSSAVHQIRGLLSEDGKQIDGWEMLSGHGFKRITLSRQ